MTDSVTHLPVILRICVRSSRNTCPQPLAVAYFFAITNIGCRNSGFRLVGRSLSFVKGQRTPRRMSCLQTHGKVGESVALTTATNTCCTLLAELTTRPRRWRQDVTPKLRQASTRLPGVTYSTPHSIQFAVSTHLHVLNIQTIGKTFHVKVGSFE